MTLDPRTPVIVGVSQTLRRPNPADASEPAEMMVEALRLAGDDSGAGSLLLEQADSIRVPKVVSWPYTDPGALVAARVGAQPAETVYCTDGGNTPQLLVNDAAAAIARGARRVVLLVGAEATYTRLRARKQEVWLDWAKQAGGEPTRLVGEPRPGVSDLEAKRGLDLPVHIYPVFETALRSASALPVSTHRLRIAQLWSRFSEVAAQNPHAWSPRRLEPNAIATPTPSNRMVASPYTKAMCANSNTDQAAAVIVCSVEAARAAGVPEDRWVFPWSGGDAHDHWYLSERADLHSSPALRAVGRATLGLADVAMNDVDHLDLYACFPSAVQVAAAELGIDLDDAARPPTVTGGNSFAGAPGNNYGMHAIAAMVEVLRSQPGTLGLLTGVGWYLTKHSAGLYSTKPPRQGFRRATPQPEVDRLPRRVPGDDYEGDVTVEAYTVVHARSGEPTHGVVAGLTPDGRRVWGVCRKPDAVDAMTTGDCVGLPAYVDTHGTLHV